MRKKKLEKIECEICGEKEKAALHYHHIVERTEKETTNHDLNLAIVCSSCHSKIKHKSKSQSKGSIVIIGLYPSTKIPYKRTLIYEKDGVSNCPDITETYYKPQVQAMKLYKKEEK